MARSCAQSYTVAKGKSWCHTQSCHQSSCFELINSTFSLSLTGSSILIKSRRVLGMLTEMRQGGEKGGRKSNVEEAEAEAEGRVGLKLVTKRKLV